MKESRSFPMREVVVPTFVSMSQPISRTLEELAAAGVRLVELHGDAPDTHIDVTDDAEVNALAEVVRGLPLEVYSVHCAFSKPNEETWDISQPDGGRRAAALRNRTKVIRASARLGVRHVIVHAGVGQRGDERLSLSRASLAELAEIAQDAGTRIAVENLEPDHLGGSLGEMESLLDGLDPAVVGFCLDTGHAMLGKDPLRAYIEALGGRMFGIHWHGNDSSSDGHLFPELGEADWEDFFAALDEIGYDLPVTVEAAPPATISLEEALRSLRAALRGERAPHTA
jgi:sugar phosphate isomerase/epimerase